MPRPKTTHDGLVKKVKSVVKDFPVVCVGGSAGGLDAYTRLLRHLPDEGAAGRNC